MKKSMTAVSCILALMAVSGCANLKFQWAASYKTDNLAGALEDVVTKGGAELTTKPATPSK